MQVKLRLDSLQGFSEQGTVVLRAEEGGTSQVKIFLEKQYHSRGNNKDGCVKVEIRLVWSGGWS